MNESEIVLNNIYNRKSVRTYTDDNDDYSRNENIIIQYQRFESGRYYYMIFLKPEIHYIVADIVKNNTDGNLNNYILKYRIDESEPAYYYLDSDRNVTPILDNYNLEINFNGVRECDSGCTLHDNFVVYYVINFYDKELFTKEVIDEIIVDETPIYSYNLTKKGKEETRSVVNWKVKIQEFDKKEQLVQIIAYASYEGNEESFAYKSFNIHYEFKGVDRDFEFWIILMSFIAAIIITFIGMYVYTYAKIEIGRRTLMLNTPNISLIQSSSDRSSGNTKTNSRVTI